MEYTRNVFEICCYYEESGVGSGRSLLRPAIQNLKLVNYENRVIVTLVLI